MKRKWNQVLIFSKPTDRIMTSASRHRASLLITCLLLNTLVESRRTKPPASGLRENAASLRAKRNGEDAGEASEPKPARGGAAELRAKRAEKNKDLAPDALPVAGEKKRGKGKDASTSKRGGDKDAPAAPKRNPQRYAKTPAPTETGTTYTPTASTPSPIATTTTKASKTITSESPTAKPTKLGGGTSEPTTLAWMGSTDQPTWWSAWQPDWGAWKDNNMANYSTMGKTGKGAKGMHYAKSGKSKAGKASAKSSKSKAAKAMDDWYDDWNGDDWYGDDWYDDWQPAMPPPEYWVPGVNGPSMGNGMKPNGDDMQGGSGWGGGDMTDTGSKPGWEGSSKPDTGSKPGWGGSGKPGGGSQGGHWGSWGGGNQGGGSWGGSNKPGWGGSWGSGWWGGWGSLPPIGSVKPSPNQPLFPPTPVPFSTAKPSAQVTEGIPTYSPCKYRLV